MDKTELGKQVVALIEQHHNVALRWGTGTGKSKAALDMLRAASTKTINRFKVLLILAETAHFKNWFDQCEQWTGSIQEYTLTEWHLSWCDFTVICYASLKKYENTQWNAVVYDEAHHLDTDIRLSIAATIKSDYNILLSATLPQSLIYNLYPIMGRIKIHNVTLKNAIEWEILPEPKIYLIPLDLDNTHYDCTFIEKWGKTYKRKPISCYFQDRWNYMKHKDLYPDVELQIKCTEQQYYNMLTDKHDFYKNRFMHTHNEIFKNMWLQYGSKRKLFLGERKTDRVVELLNLLNGKYRYICFCASILQATALGAQYCVHSKIKHPETIINRFNTKQTNSIFAVGMLQEGMNLTDIDAGVIIQLDNNERGWIQKHGRVLRSENPMQFIFYFRNTRDTEYLAKVTDSLDKSCFTEVQDIKTLHL